MQAKQQEASQALADSQAKLAAGQQAQQQAERAAQQAKDASAEAEKKLADTRSQLDDQTKLVSEASQKLASLGQQTQEADKATTDAAAAREEAQKQLAQAQAELGKAIKADAVPHLRNTFLAQIRQAVGAKPGVQVADDRLVITNDGLFLSRQHHVVARRARSADADRHRPQECDRATVARYGLADPSSTGTPTSSRRRAVPQQLGSVGGPRRDRRTLARRQRHPGQADCGGDLRREPTARPGRYARGLRQEPPHRDPLDRAMIGAGQRLPAFEAPPGRAA